MRNLVGYILLAIIFSVFACQKGIHWDIDSEGNLLKDSAGNCEPIIVSGSFMVNNIIGDSNFLTVTVKVTLPGRYSITTDSVNGYIFKASGIFSKSGIIPVKLACNGKPLAAGTDHLNVYYNSSICEAVVNVLPDTLTPANYTFQGAPGTCMDYTLRGNYLQAVELDSSNKLIINVNVITPGKYSITTNNINGYNFSGSGVFTTTGAQTVIIKGSGKPVNTGDDTFTVNANNNTCSFFVKVVKVAVAKGNLHFPLTQGSFWVYVDPVYNDTAKRYINGDTLINDTSFVRMNELIKPNITSAFYNFDNINYKEFAKVEKYNSSFIYKPAVYGSLLFLKENLATDAQWESSVFQGSSTTGQMIYFKYVYHCTSTTATKIINYIGFKDVYVIEIYPQFQSGTNTWNNTNEVYRSYYAKGIGLIYVEQSINGLPFQPLLKLVSWMVN